MISRAGMALLSSRYTRQKLYGTFRLKNTVMLFALIFSLFQPVTSAGTNSNELSPLQTKEKKRTGFYNEINKRQHSSPFSTKMGRKPGKIYFLFNKYTAISVEITGNGGSTTYAPVSRCFFHFPSKNFLRADWKRTKWKSSGVYLTHTRARLVCVCVCVLLRG